jgi:hypothetical protein
MVAQSMEYYETYCTIPAFQNIITALPARLDPSAGLPSPEIAGSGNPFMFLPSTCAPLFRRVLGLTSRGLLAITVDDVSDALRDPNPESAISQHAWASVCFTLFTCSPSSSGLSWAINPYLNIMTQIDSYPQFVKFEALARLLTLCRMAITIGGEEAIRILLLPHRFSDIVFD